ncbi:GntR family transcriptional regulator [Clostridium cellulovorans]|uniref:Transcriptional regulator, GntR family n=1 Tax=Clostridium cellulovorans (strain ATCC 35296 / DSM 3052 / OCM 3 / 743B) TaxID=573061 RepID=D9SR64_CLOC7|nr:GntR family transcriptional regulator [Clostridium cellulovorans]ADL50352.1 transcriptional regulator, GntR family [Clostridium cellulovorans 743B]
MSYYFDDKIPIYLQIMDIIKQNIVSGELSEGDKLLSVREMAEKYSVNPNTIQRAYQELERNNIIYTQRGMGTFITKDSSKIEEIKNTMAVDIVITFIDGMKKIGFASEEAIKVLQNYVAKEMKG